MKYNDKNWKTILCLILLSFTFHACKKMDATYSDYLGNAEIVYIHKADSLKLHPGKNRVELSWLLGSDTRVESARIFWNNRTDSSEHKIIKAIGVDTVAIVINNLPEGAYTFEVFTYDNKGNSSIKADVSGNVYGENYAATLINRKVKTALFQNLHATINWYNPTQNAIGVELTYTNNNDKVSTIMVPIADSQTVIDNYKQSSEILYRTLFLPEKSAIDTFYTRFESIIP